MLLLFALLLAASGCRRVSDLWSGQSVSPDGYWIATANAMQIGDGGGATLETIVHLKRAEGANPVDALWQREPWRPFTVLRLSGQPPAPPAAAGAGNPANGVATDSHNIVATDNPQPAPVEMIWLSPTLLELAYRGPAHIDFHLDDCSGVKILLRDLSAASNAPPPDRMQP